MASSGDGLVGTSHSTEEPCVHGTHPTPGGGIVGTTETPPSLHQDLQSASRWYNRHPSHIWLHRQTHCLRCLISARSFVASIATKKIQIKVVLLPRQR